MRIGRHFTDLAVVRVELCLKIAFCKRTVATGKLQVAVFTNGEQWVFVHNPNLSLKHDRTPHERPPRPLFSCEAQRPFL
jgi:hypothetical protein